MSNIQIIDRVSIILRSFNIDQFEMGISELAKATSLARSTVHRLATAMVKADLLNYDPEKFKYSLGIGLLYMGNVIRQKLSLTMVARKYMIKLRDLTNESIMLKVVDQGQSVIIEFVETEAYLRPKLGQRTYLYAGASSKLLLAYMLDEEIELILQEGIVQLTANSLTIDKLRVEITQIRKLGYSVSFGEIVNAGMSISVPICDSSQKVIASLSLNAPAYRITDEKIGEFLKHLSDSGQKVSKELGFNPNLPIEFGRTDYYTSLSKDL